jgi:hypothetical protein
LDSSKACRIDSEFDREEAKEEEYDYFLDAKTDENANEALGYHVIDENQKDESEDLEELDEDEKRERFENMLEDFRRKIDRDE